MPQPPTAAVSQLSASRTHCAELCSFEVGEEHPRLRDHVDPSRFADLAVEFDAVEDEVNAS